MWGPCKIGRLNLSITNSTANCIRRKNNIDCHISCNVTPTGNVTNNDHFIQEITNLTMNYIATCV
jgi:hypothetical protein